MPSSIPMQVAAGSHSNKMLKGGAGEGPVIGNGSFGGKAALSVGLAAQQVGRV